jgi:hypothetical protein
MNKFERYHIEDPPRERHERIEKSPEDYYPDYVICSDESIKPLEKKVKILHEKDKSKSIKRKSKKVPSRSNKSAVAKTQKEL